MRSPKVYRPPVRGAPGMNAVQLLPLVRELFSRLPEMRCLQAWEMQSALFLLGYTDELEDEAVIEAAADVARMDYDPDRRAA
jgi:hypothetical protein